MWNYALETENNASARGNELSAMSLNASVTGNYLSETENSTEEVTGMVLV
ncbi:MAG: hypothetical protein WC947_09515 [Elusimicrobiota bacterium]